MKIADNITYNFNVLFKFMQITKNKHKTTENIGIDSFAAK